MTALSIEPQQQIIIKIIQGIKRPESEAELSPPSSSLLELYLHSPIRM